MHDVDNHLLSPNKLEFVLAQAVEKRLNDEPQTPCLSSTSNTALLSLKLLLPAGQNIFIIRDGFVICFLMKTLNFINDFPFTTLG